LPIMCVVISWIFFTRALACKSAFGCFCKQQNDQLLDYRAQHERRKPRRYIECCLSGGPLQCSTLILRAITDCQTLFLSLLLKKKGSANN
jgi:hypothetical protein